MILEITKISLLTRRET